MQAVVLYHSGWEPTRLMALEVASALGCRAVPFDRRPDLALYELVVLALPAIAVLDPRVTAFTALEVRGKTLAIMSDAGPMGEPLFWGLDAAALLGGARVYLPQLHASTGLLADTRALAVRQARAWGVALARSFPRPTFPKGPAGKRIMQ